MVQDRYIRVGIGFAMIIYHHTGITHQRMQWGKNLGVTMLKGVSDYNALSEWLWGSVEPNWRDVAYALQQGAVSRQAIQHHRRK